MNKILLVIIIAMGMLLGGYFLLPQEKLDVLSQYLPTPFSEWLGTTEKDNIDIEQEMKRKPDLEANSSLSVSKSIGFSDTQRNNADEIIKEPDSQKGSGEIKSFINKEELEEKHTTVAKEDASEKLVKIEILTNDTPEVIKIKKRMLKIQKRIKDFDDTNSNLQARYDKIIQRNRVLTLELKKINDTIKEAQ